MVQIFYAESRRDPMPCLESARPPLVLVTGASGFLGSHVVKQLLDDGFSVRGTVRSLPASTANDFLRAMDTMGQLELVQADLVNTPQATWDSYAKVCTFCIHVASPFPSKKPVNASA